METQQIIEIAIPIALVAGGVVAGYFLERVILRWLDAVAARTRWRTDNIIFKSIRGVPIFWGLAGGLYLATLTVDTESAFLTWFQTVILVAVLWSFTIIAARVAADLTGFYAGREGSFLPKTSLIPGFVRLLVYIFGGLIILNELDLSIAPLLTALGVGGLAVALALQDTLANVFAGLYLIASGQVGPGDYVRLDSGEEGYVIDINWRSTNIRTLLENVVIVPNAKFASSIVTNYNLSHREMLVRVPVAVDYDSDLRKVEQVTLEVAREVMQQVVPGISRADPQVFFHTFGEFSLNLTVVMRVREVVEQYRLRHEFIVRIIERYEREGIRIPFPIKEFEMELSTEGLDAGRTGSLTPPSLHEAPAASDSVYKKANPDDRETLAGGSSTDPGLTP